LHDNKLNLGNDLKRALDCMIWSSILRSNEFSAIAFSDQTDFFENNLDFSDDEFLDS
jgi:hypothetical protein